MATSHGCMDDRLVFSFADLSGERLRAPGLFAVNADGSGFQPLIARQSRYGFQSRRRYTHVVVGVGPPPCFSSLSRCLS